MRPDKAILGGAMKLPKRLIDVAKTKKQLTAKFQPMGEPERKIAGYVDDGEFLRVPRQYGIKICNQFQIDWEDHTSDGFPIKFPRVPPLRDYQEGPVNDIDVAFDSYYDVVFRARTAFGKTFSSLWLAAQFGRTTLIVVDQENLLTQWLDETLVPLFGFKREDIGIIQGDRCDYKGKPVVIAMLQTLSQKEFPQAVYDYFGFVIFDEVHTIGAPTRAIVLMDFSASMRLAVSATPKRSDGLQKLLDANLGAVRVAADAEHSQSAVYLLRNEAVYSWYGNVSPKVGRIISEVADDGARNLQLAYAIKWLHETGRHTLVLSDRVSHLNEMRVLLEYLGVDPEIMGMYVGDYYVWAWVKDPTPSKLPAGIVKHEETNEYEYTPVKLALIPKKTPKAKLKEIKASSSIILATYGMFQKGVDVPRLSGGVDITPRGKASQVHGRIKRGKSTLMPIWVTMVDDNNYRLLHSFVNRARDYLKDNAEIFEWTDEGSITLCHSSQLLQQTASRVIDLKAQRIEKSDDGRFILRTPEAVKEQKRMRETAIVEEIRLIRQRSRKASSAVARGGRSSSQAKKPSTTRKLSRSGRRPKP